MFLSSDFEKFITIYEELNLSKAADRLDSYQGALSKVLLKLETRLGEALFIRSNRGLFPTETAHALYTTINQQNKIWDDFNTIRLKLKFEPQGTYRIGGHSVVLNQFSKKFANLLGKYEKLNLEFEFLRSPEATRKVLNHELDFAIIVDPVPFDELVILPLKKEDIACYAKSAKSSNSNTYYNPEIIYSKNIKKLKRRLIPILDYELAAQMALQSNGSALIPESVAKRNQLMHKTSPTLYVANINLVLRSDYHSNSGIKMILNEIKN